MTDSVRVVNTGRSDLESIFRFFEDSIAYQEKKGYPVWRDYDKATIISDIENKNQYKIAAGDNTLIVFSICYSDKVIWRTLDAGHSAYLHRIVVNPQFKGQKLFGKILEWTIDHARQKKLRSVRMDTWADNPNLITYYQNFGFTVVEHYITPDTPELPVHNRSLALALLEYELK